MFISGHTVPTPPLLYAYSNLVQYSREDRGLSVGMDIKDLTLYLSPDTLQIMHFLYRTLLSYPGQTFFH